MERQDVARRILHINRAFCEQAVNMRCGNGLPFWCILASFIIRLADTACDFCTLCGLILLLFCFRSRIPFYYELSYIYIYYLQCGCLLPRRAIYNLIFYLLNVGGAILKARFMSYLCTIIHIYVHLWFLIYNPY